MEDVFINKLSKFLPNEPVSNDEMESYLGLIKGVKSRCKPIILRNNGIKKRYYALDKDGKSTHNAAELDAEAIKMLFDDSFKLHDIELLACGSSTPEHFFPGHASMVHGCLGGNNLEVVSPAGTCNTSMQAMKYGYMAIMSGEMKNVVCTGSQKASVWLIAENFEEEVQYLDRLGENPYIAFEKDFLRWMLSDGAGAALLQPVPNKNQNSLRIDSINIRSYANEAPTCMYAGGVKLENGEMLSWREFTQKEQMQQSMFSIRQDVKVLEEYVTRFATGFMADLHNENLFDIHAIDYFLPHLSSEFFRSKLMNGLEEKGLSIPEEKYFTNLSEVGNVGAASPYIMLEELFNSDKLEKGDKLLLLVPESARFSYTLVHFTVV